MGGAARTINSSRHKMDSRKHRGTGEHDDQCNDQTGSTEKDETAGLERGLERKDGNASSVAGDMGDEVHVLQAQRHSSDAAGPTQKLEVR